MATGFPTKANWAAGDVLTASAMDDLAGTVNLLSNASAATGSALLSNAAGTSFGYQQVIAAGKNFAINGGFDIWQRGTSIALGSNGYAADRWFSGTGGTVTISRQSTGVPVNSQYCMRIAATSASSYANQLMYMETAQIAPLWGNTITVSVKVRRNATMNAGLALDVFKSPTVDAGNSATWTILTNISGTRVVTNANLPTGTTATDWYTLSAQYVIPNDGSANGLKIQVAESSALVNGSYWEQSELQIEIGSIQTAFSRAGGNIQGELAACQRYYWRWGGNSNFQRYGTGLFNSTTQAYAYIQFPVLMRATPTSMDYSILGYYDGATSAGFSGATMQNNGQNGTDIALTGTGFTTYRPFILGANNSTSSYIGFSAEL
jgi:hypothetical protein